MTSPYGRGWAKARAAAMEAAEGACQLSGHRHNRLHVHHIDCDPTNNALENLLVVTPKVHRQLHRFIETGGQDSPQWRARCARLHMIMYRKWPKVGRNDPCLCQSGRKFKKCCMK